MGASTSLLKHRREDKHKEWRKDFCCRQVQRTFFWSWYLPCKGPQPTCQGPQPTCSLMSLRRDAAYTHSDLTVLDNIFIFEVLCSIMCFTDNLMFREKRIRSSSAVSMTSTGFANMTWHGIPLTPSPVGWSSRLVEASKIHNFDKSWQTSLFQSSGNSGEFVQLVVSGLEYTGPKDLTQYFIRFSSISAP